jgi:RHS repeat-associated protein
VVECRAHPVFAARSRRGSGGRSRFPVRACEPSRNRERGRRRMRGKNRCTRAAGHAVYRARYYNPYISRFINADPSGFAGGLNFYAFCGDNPISNEDPFGLGYWSDVGQVWVGYGQAVGGTATGFFNAAVHPINTAVGVYNAVSSPVQTYNAISTSIASTWNSGLQGQGQIVGNVLIAAGTIGAGTTMGSVRLAGISDTLANATTDASYAQNLLYYEIGQKTLPTADYLANYAEIANPVDRGAQIVADQGWLNALTPQSSGWALGLGKTFGTDPTPLGWFGVAGVGAASQAGQLGSTGNNSSTGK